MICSVSVATADFCISEVTLAIMPSSPHHATCIWSQYVTENKVITCPKREQPRHQRMISLCGRDSLADCSARPRFLNPQHKSKMKSTRHPMPPVAAQDTYMLHKS